MVLKSKESTEFRLIGVLGFKGVFDGEHIFELSENNRITKLIHREKFYGLLVPLFWNKLNTNARRGFGMMNEALKKRSEQQINFIIKPIKRSIL